MPFPFSIFFESVCLVFAMVFLSHRGTGWWRYIMLFLLLTVMVEIAGYYIVVVSEGKTSNHWLHNLFLPAEVTFTGWILYRIINPYFDGRPWFLGGLAVFSGLYLYESAGSKWAEYSSLANSVASVWFVVTCCIFFYHLLRDDRYTPIGKDAAFWMVAGCFFFYFCSTACNLFFSYLVTINTRTGAHIRYYIISFLNLVYYGCWSYAFLCKYQQKISSSQ
jgi:hypothetical protein